jgi:hypothetical protein
MAKGDRKRREPARRPKRAQRKAHKPKKVVRVSKQGKVRTQAQPFRATIFTVANDDVGRLTPAQAVELLRDILWADARGVGIPTTSINVSAWVDVPDGGIDASVIAERASLRGSVIKSHRLGFQVKAGTGFQPWQESHIRAELFGDQPPKKTNLGASVRACLDEGGTYLLVCTGVDLPDAQERQGVGHAGSTSAPTAAPPGVRGYDAPPDHGREGGPMTPSPELVARLRECIRAYVEADIPDPLDLRRAARALDLLPVVEVIGRWHGVRTDGAVVSFALMPPHEEREESDRWRRAFVISLGRADCPELDGLVPPRSLNSRPCLRCGGTGEIRLGDQGMVPCVCAGVGWLPPISDEASKPARPHDDSAAYGEP